MWGDFLILLLVVLLLEWERELPTPLEMEEHFAPHFQMPLLVHLRFVVHLQQCSCLTSCSATLSWAWLPLAGSLVQALVQDQVWLAGPHFDSEGSG